LHEVKVITSCLTTRPIFILLTLLNNIPMKKISLIILLFPLFCIAQQQFHCDFIPDASFYNTAIYSNRLHKIPNVNGQRFVFNVKFHFVLATDGTNNDNLGEGAALRMIAQLNIRFNQHNIFYKYHGYDSINDSNFLVFGQNGAWFDTLRDRFINEGVYEETALNVFVVHTGVQAASSTKDIYLSAIIGDYMYNEVLLHEFGHTLGLFHIEAGSGLPLPNNASYLYDNLPICINPIDYVSYNKITKPVFIANVNSENVTRDPQNIHYNADNTGDWVADTGACFSDFTYNFDRITNDQQSSGCNVYHFKEDSRVLDAVGETYKNIDLLNRNFMIGQSLNLKVENIDRFTTGQADRMKETILANTAGGSLLRQKLSRNADGTANIQPLYEPFQTSRLVTGIASTFDNGDGTAHVCKNYVSSNYMFQPGFDYEFPDNELPDLNFYTTDQTPLVETPHFNCPIKILQLSNDIMQVPTVCRGFFCVDERFLYGTKYSTQVLGSMNITEEQLSEIQVKDPNLYDTLMSQYYHILKKITSSGAKVETIIYKQ
jgi:hypothetical protein